jgi:23S rRNA pseudouridine1911/1915/1917 synthase
MEHKISVKAFKIRLDKYLAEQLPEISRSQIQRDIEDGLVYVNGEKVQESKFVVRLNDIVVYHQSEIPASPVGRAGRSNLKSELKPTNTPLKILYNDHGLLIIDKPAGLVVHPGAGFKGETLASALLYNFKDIKEVGEDHRPGIVHRLDKDTSGVILVAKDQAMYEYLKSAFQERKIKKEYIALVSGTLEKPQGFVDSPIGQSKTDFRKQTVKNPKDPKEALTEYKVLEHLSLTPFALGKGALPHEGREKVSSSRVDTATLLLVKLHTGRTHQIRVHMASLGHPLMGDSLYASKKTLLKGLGRQFLHAKRIEVRLPDGTWIEAETDLPSDLRDVLEKVGSKAVKSL